MNLQLNKATAIYSKDRTILYIWDIQKIAQYWGSWLY